MLNLKQRLSLLLLLGCGYSIFNQGIFCKPAAAQVTTDGTTNTRVDVSGNNFTINQGDRAGTNLFHSFGEFSVPNGGSAFFNSSENIANIFSRVTGNHISHIDGILGTNGTANLFLINPAGIIFGENAKLDIRGSFYGGTAESLLLGDGLEFSATNPQTAPLITINVTPGLGDWLNIRGEITNQGNLEAGKNLTLIGNSLDLEGKLQAGNNLTLKAVDNIQIRDRANFPFQATAGNQLLIEGDKLVDIFALNNSASGLIAGGDLILRSQNSIMTDSYFSSGGNFRIEDLNDNLSNATSPNDPIIRANGDVSFNSYTGTSLHIFAGGSVNIDNIEITGADPNNGIVETVTLSDGVNTVAINGSAQPTLDIRAGTTNIEPIGIQGNNQGLPSISETNGTPNNADIQINQITNPGGLVFLTNQDQPNTSLSGNIEVGSVDLSSETDGGSVILDSRGGINVAQQIEVSGFGGNGGDVQLIANGDIVIPREAQVLSFGFAGIGGEIAITSKSAIRVANLQSVTGEGIGKNIELKSPEIFIEPSTSPFQELIGNALIGEGQGGNIQIEADSLEIRGNAIAVAVDGDTFNTFGIGNSGNVLIDADTVSLDNGFIFSAGLSSLGGNTGDIEIQTDNLTLTNGSQISSSIFSGFIVNSGNVNIRAKNSINLIGNLNETPSSIVTDIFPGATGNGGVISITTSSLNLQEGGQIRASTSGNGNAGSILINAENISLDGAVSPDSEGFGSAILSEVLETATGNGQTIEIKAEQLTITNGGIISSATGGMGDAGNINITATEFISFDGLFDNQNQEKPQPSGAFVSVAQGAVGQGGTLMITTPSLFVTNGAQLEAETEDSGNAGDINIFATDSVLLSGEDTGLFSDTRETSTGDAGEIFVDSEVIEIRDRAAISVNSQGTGKSGTITIRAENLNLDLGSISATNAFSQEETDSSLDNINLFIKDNLILRNNSTISAEATNNADGGNITIDAGFIVGFRSTGLGSDIRANAGQGQGGNIRIETQGVLNFNQSRLTVNQENNINDIDASSQAEGLDGSVTILNPDTAHLVTNPEIIVNLIESEKTYAQACQGARVSDQPTGLTVKGKGGIPSLPTEIFESDIILLEEQIVPSLQSRYPEIKPIKTNIGDIYPARGILKTDDGKVFLTAYSTENIKTRTPHIGANCTRQ